MKSSAKVSVFGIVLFLLSAASLVVSAHVPGFVTDYDQNVRATRPAESGSGPGVSVSSFQGIVQGGGFLANHGQLERRDVRLYASLGDLSVGFVPGALLLNLRDRPSAPFHLGLDGRFVEGPNSGTSPQALGGVLLRVAFDSANPVVPVGRGLLPYPTHFFFGNDPTQWRTDVPSYHEILYQNLYDGIDLVYRLQDGRLKYEFHVQPSADPAEIRWTVAGANAISLDAHGDLILQTQAGDLVDDAPASFQEGEGLIAVPSRYTLLGAATVGFEVDAYDSSHALVIDPGLDYSTFLGGGNSVDLGFAVAVDAGGNATVTGYTNSVDFPTTSGAYDTSINGLSDVFVLRLNPSGKLPVYSTFVGGTLDEVGLAIALDHGGNATVTGYTNSVGFPTTSGAFDTAQNGQNDVFVFRLNATGSGLAYSTFVGGTGSDIARALALDAVGTATVTGYTNSANFPATSGAFDTLPNGVNDVFVFRMNSAGSALLYSTFAGGSVDDYGVALGLDTNGAAIVTGYTNSANFPATFDAYDTSFGGGYDAFVLRLNPSGSDLEYGTFVGGWGDDLAMAVATDAAGAATVGGYTSSSNFPTTSGAFDTSFADVYDDFVLRLNAFGSNLDYSTFVGGSATDLVLAMALDADGTATVSGYTNSGNFPTTPGAFDRGYNGLVDVYVFRLNPTGGKLLYSTFLGGSLDDIGRAVAVYTPATVLVAGNTYSDNFPTTPGAFDTTYNAYSDAFVARLTASLEPTVSNLGVQGHTASPGIVHVTVFTPDLNWSYADPEGDPQSQYEVRVGTSSGGNEMWAPGSQAGSSSMVPYAGSTLSRGVDYYYGVHVFDGTAWSEWKEVRFRLNEIPYAPATPISPDDSATIPPNPVETLWWTSGGDPDGDALTFDWQVSTDSAFATILSSGTTTNPTSAPFSTSPSMTYYWRVQAWDGYEFSAYGNAPTGYWTFATETANRPPIADAGPDQTARKQTLVTLDGSASSDPDGDPVTFTWTAPSGIVLSDPSATSPTFTPAKSGVYAFQLSVGDGGGGTGADSVIITVTNGGPDAKVGGNQTVQKFALVTLDGSGSSDPDGDPLSYQWKQVSGPAVTLSGSTTSTATFPAAMSGAFLFTLMVDDGDGGSDIDTVLVTVENQAPIANAGPDQVVPKNVIVTLVGTGSVDPNGDTLAFLWQQVSGPAVILSGATMSTATFSATMSGAFLFTLTVDDGDGRSDTDSVLVTVENQGPIARAGLDQSVLKRTIVALDGSASSDPNGDSLSYQWEQVSGPAVTLSGATMASATFTPTSAGTYGFTLTVLDSEGRSGTDALVVTVRNRLPAADPGSDQSVLKKDVVTLTGSASSDPDDDPLSFSWQQVSGPSVSLSGATSSIATFIPHTSGIYAFVLTVADGDGGSTGDSVVVTAQNRPPIADAGQDRSAAKRLPITLDASGSFDPDSDALSYRWTQVGGPSVTLTGATTPAAMFTPAVAGTYAFALTVDDGDGGTMTDYVVSVVGNRDPVAEAGPDLIVSSRAPVGLTGAGSHDLDGDELAYQWQQIGGPVVTISGADEALASFTPPKSATYLFELRVSDGDGGFAEDVVAVTVQNAAPVARAGTDELVRKNALVTLDGTDSSDPDGSPLTYAWQQIGGPAVTLTGATEVTATFTPSTSGAYVFTLVVDDRDGGIDRDSVVITVQNRGPTANAGSAEPREPGASVSLDGSGSYDVDGDSLSYAWTQEGGPLVTLNGAETPTARFTPTEVGTYVFRLTVTDGEGASDVDTVLVRITGPTVVRVPTPFPVEPLLVALLVVLTVLLILSLRRRGKGKEDTVVNETTLPSHEEPSEE